MRVSTQKTKKNRQNDRRAEIIGIAKHLFVENGFAATSMSSVANAVGLTKASLYHHFPGKDDLFAACVTEGLSDELLALRKIAEDSETDPKTRMRAVLEALYETFIFSPAGRMSPLIAEVSRSFPTVARAFHDDYMAPQHEILVQLLDEGVASGRFADIERKVYLHMVFGPIVTLSLTREMFATFEDLDQIFPVETLRDGHIENMLKLIGSSQT
ncbi:MAG TPA: TetR/AcrR family transcriptional regulator [Roseovarius sp.]|nr:TetR/AcrR family transcriptional regulator [Roseovarius sp.]